MPLQNLHQSEKADEIYALNQTRWRERFQNVTLSATVLADRLVGVDGTAAQTALWEGDRRGE
jgi:hypothetical protein